MAPLPDSHPDGDPFAEQDKAKQENSLIGRMERQAKLEAQQQGLDENGQSLTASRKKEKVAVRTSLGVNKDGKELLVLDTSDDEGPSEGEAQATDGEEDDHSGGDEDEEEEGEEEGGSSNEGSGIEGREEGSSSKKRHQEEGSGEDDEDDSEDEDSEDDSSSSVATGDRGQDGDGDVSMADADGNPKPKSPVKPSISTSGKDGAVTEGGELGPDGQPQKEKKKRRRRALNRSPSPPPLAVKQPPPTVRLSISLPPRDSYETREFNVIGMARAAGLLPPEEAAKKEDHSGGEESESDGQGGRRKVDKGKGKADGEGNTESREGSGPPVSPPHSFLLCAKGSYSDPLLIHRQRNANVVPMSSLVDSEVTILKILSSMIPRSISSR